MNLVALKRDGHRRSWSMNIRLARTAIIAGDAELTEQVCSRLRTPGVYLPVVEAPTVRLVECGVYEQDCVRLANAMRNLHAGTFLCLKVPPEIVENLRKRTPGLKFILMEEYDAVRLAAVAQVRHTTIRYQDLILRDADFPPSCMSCSRGMQRLGWWFVAGHRNPSARCRGIVFRPNRAWIIY